MMKKILKLLIVLLFCAPGVVGAVTLGSNAHVNVTSDTAATAKSMAMNEARRQIITEVLSNYADAEQLESLVGESKDSKLTNLISSTSIENERLSATTYSANIKMNVDALAAKKWLVDNNVRNWLGGDDTVDADKTIIFATVSGGLRGWIDFMRTMRDGNLNIDVKNISGDQVMINIPATGRSSFITAITRAGWTYSDINGTLRIWK